MTKFKSIRSSLIGTAIAAVSLAGTAMVPAPAAAQSASKPDTDVTLSVGSGRMVRLNGAMSDLFVANDAIADVQVRSPNQIYIFGKTAGETTVYATNAAGKVVYSANVRVGQNIDSVDNLLRMAMPEAQIQATPMNGVVLLTGTVAAPADVEEATRLVQAFVGANTQIISRLKTATPLQVMLQVKIAEVSRTLTKSFGVNLEAIDPTSGFKFFAGSGRDFTTIDPETGGTLLTRPDGSNSYNLMGRLFGLNVSSAIDANQNDGLVTVLAEPTLTALSGETASFLAGGEFPIAVSNGISGTSIEFKEYGVSLAFTPIVLEGGRISMRVRPEVSELTSEGAISLNGFEVPALTTRRAETTVELGSGQSFVIGGLLRNGANNTVDKTPWLGDIPVLGALFRSTNFRRNETELVIVVTPYLVKPVSASQIALPTDGFRSANDAQRVLIDQQHDSRRGEQRPMPQSAPPQTVAPAVGAAASASAPAAPAQTTAAAPQPGFSF